MDLQKRFESKFIKTDNGCWEWTANIINSGYGQFCIGKKKISAHRFSYEFYKGSIAAGLFVCHTCDNRICVNPDHLFLGTNSDNVKDGIEKGRIIPPNSGIVLTVSRSDRDYLKTVSRHKKQIEKAL